MALAGCWEEDGEGSEDVGEREGEGADSKATHYAVALGEGGKEEELGEHYDDAEGCEEDAYVAGLGVVLAGRGVKGGGCITCV